ncbi:MAG: hypothetical protein P1U63_11335 [Coxiellaceae bacterium]|nr:hypothetical protein [Coxiellaceae bacterium]
MSSFESYINDLTEAGLPHMLDAELELLFLRGALYGVREHYLTCKFSKPEEEARASTISYSDNLISLFTELRAPLATVAIEKMRTTLSNAAIGSDAFKDELIWLDSKRKDCEKACEVISTLSSCYDKADPQPMIRVTSSTDFVIMPRRMSPHTSLSVLTTPGLSADEKAAADPAKARLHLK